MINYLSGFGNHFVSEAIPNSLPQGCNSPQRVPHGLYAEQISGSPFTLPRHNNQRTWVYRIRPSVIGGEFKLYSNLNSNNLGSQSNRELHFKSSPFNGICPPNQLRFNPLLAPTHPTDFLHGLITMCGNGCASNLTGGAVHIYSINESMQDFFYNADAEMLFVPQMGKLLLKTELGQIELDPLEIAVIPRGIKFQVILLDKYAYGYCLENYGAPFKLPDLGPIGSNGLANPRDFLTPQAYYEHSTITNNTKTKYNYNLICKFEGNLWQAALSHSPLDVVAWHGNYVPYKYDLRKFNTIGTVSFDHPDPSIFTVLTSPTATFGMANIDFVIFPPRYMVAENTFRPPWYHRNIMSEFMGLITGQYDAKPDGFLPGGASIHNRMIPHGPDGNSCQKAINATLEPEYLANTMAFMFEAIQVWRPTQFALTTPQLQQNYINCWQDIPILFTGL